MWWRSWWSECLSDVGKRERERRTLGLGIARGAPPTMQECLDPRISTTRLLFFCAHKKGSSNFDLLAFFLFDSLSRSSSSASSPVLFHPAPRLLPPVHAHPARYRESQVVNGVFLSTHFQFGEREREKERLGTRPVYATSK